MTSVLLDPDYDDTRRRQALWSGDILLFSPSAASAALCDYAWQMLCDAFAPVHPDDAQHSLPVERFVAAAAPLKTAFTHSEEAHRLVGDLIVELGADPDKTFFDLPKLRLASSHGYLTAGVGYAYQPHRDSWYAAPFCQQNFWLPISTISPDNCLAFHPRHWVEPCPNSSAGFDAYEWNSTGRAEAAKHISTDTRNHPVATGEVEIEPMIKPVGRASSVLLFSGAQLHSTVPNVSGRTRFSLDFRTVHVDDVVSRAGSPNVDSAATGTTLHDFIGTRSFAPLPAEVIAPYDTGSNRGVKVFDPAVLQNH
jgi:hypothetical protein